MYLNVYCSVHIATLIIVFGEIDMTKFTYSIDLMA